MLCLTLFWACYRAIYNQQYPPYECTHTHIYIYVQEVARHIANRIQPNQNGRLFVSCMSVTSLTAIKTEPVTWKRLINRPTMEWLNLCPSGCLRLHLSGCLRLHSSGCLRLHSSATEQRVDHCLGNKKGSSTIHWKLRFPIVIQYETKKLVFVWQRVLCVSFGLPCI